MRSIRFWFPAIIGALAVPISYYLAVASAHGADSHAGAGFVVLLLMYPVPVLLMMTSGMLGDGAFLSEVVRFVAIGTALIQFPFYGFMISYAKRKPALWLKASAAIIWFHIAVILVALAIGLIHVMI